MIDYRDTISTVDDILWVVDRYTGRDNMLACEDLLDDLKTQADYTSRAINSDLISYEMTLEDMTRDLQDMRESLESLMDYLRDTPRWDKHKIQIAVVDIYLKINELL